MTESTRKDKCSNGTCGNCERCDGIRRYPNPAPCDWCGEVHNGDANNCGSKTGPDTNVGHGGNGARDDTDIWTDRLVTSLERKYEEVKNWLKEEVQQMLPSADQESSPRRRNSGSANKYLKNENLSKTPKEAKIIAVRNDPENRFGAAVTLKLAIDGETYFYGLNIKKNPNYKILLQKFGNDENDWVGQKIMLHLEKDEFSEQWFIRVTFAKAGR